MAYLETPRTDAGNATFVNHGHDFENFSVEHSILSPIKKSEDIVSLMRNERGTTLKTPRARAPLADRRNLPAARKSSEFTPLLQSVTKKNFERHGKGNGIPETPAFLKAGYRGNESPALPGGDPSAVYGSDFGSSVLGENGSTPMPQVSSSSAQSTPLATLPKRDAMGVLNDQGNLMTLREQENIIDKIEKENFGLKLKIHFLEDALRRSGPGFNEAALKENTDLKVDRVTLQAELKRCKKTLTQAERDMEAYKHHLEEVQAKAKKEHADESIRQQLEDLKKGLQEKEEEIEELREKLEAADGENEEVHKLKDDIEDLEANLREKDRQLNEQEDELNTVNAQAKKDSDVLEDVYAELEEERKHVEALEAAEKTIEDNAVKLQEAQDELQDTLEAQRKAENDLEELQEEMSNKSFTTKGLSRQLEEKANRFQDDLNELREKYTELQSFFDDKSRQVKRLEEKLQDQTQDADVRNQRLQDKYDLLRHEHEATVRKCDSLTKETQQARKDLENKSEEKDFLHSRHDALSAESQSLQRDLSRSRTLIQELEESLENERIHAEENERNLRLQAKEETDSLSDQVSRLRREADDGKHRFVAEQDQWEGQRRELQSQKEKSDEKAAGLQRTIDKLQEVEGTLSGKEMKLQEALESEMLRHQSEEAVLERRIQDLNDDIQEKRQELEDVRSEMSQAKDDLRTSEQEKSQLERKVEALEDEIEILQSELDGEDAEKARQRLEAAEEDAESLRAELMETQQKLDEMEASGAREENDQSIKLRQAEDQLRRVNADKQSLQDRLASNNLDICQLQASCAEVEAERDEVRSQLEQMRDQVEDTFKLDQEKIEMRTSKMKLENEVSRLGEERRSLSEKNTSLERELISEIARAADEEARLNKEVRELQRKATSPTGSRDREAIAVNKKVLRLESRITELEEMLGSKADDAGAMAELSMVQKELSAARLKEKGFFEREAAQKDVFRDLRSKISLLERQNHEAEVARLTADSPKSSVAESARKNEIIELQRQLTDTHKKLKELRAKSKEDLKSLHRKLSDSENQARSHAETLEQRREQLETELSVAQQEQQALQVKNTKATQTITRLHTRISVLEQDHIRHRDSASADNSIVEERKDLHEMLKDAKLQAEDLENQVAARDTSLISATSREKDLRAQLRGVREERNLQTKKSGALTTELENLQSRYEKAVDNFSCRQREWEDERKAMNSRVRFPNMSLSSLHDARDVDVEKLERRHNLEMKGVGRQIQWLRARLAREQGFRSGLAYEKRYLSLQIQMYQACNKADLQILQRMGISPPQPPQGSRASTRLRLADSSRKSVGALIRQRPRPSLKVAGLMVLALCKMKTLAREWAGKKMIKESAVRKMEAVYRGRKRGRSVGRVR